MSEASWVAIGLAVFGVIGALFAFAARYVISNFDRKLGDVVSQVAANNKQAEDSCELKVNGVGGRVSGQEVELAAVQAKANLHGERLAALESKVSSLPTHTEITSLRTDMHALSNAVGRIEGAMGGHIAQISSAISQAITQALSRVKD